ncbi:MAG: Hpt domain-containing protein [Gammaproteobacteria bacterium]|nr:Hpt domain-containing protein [Gammaproteobacteria bacterium]
MAVNVENELIDWERSIVLADNDPDLATDILKLTSNSLPTDLQEIETAFRNEDEREMRRLLHKLEGGISYASLPRLEAITLKVHKAVRELDNEHMAELMQELRSAVMDTLGAIAQQINS